MARALTGEYKEDWCISAINASVSIKRSASSMLSQRRKRSRCATSDSSWSNAGQAASEELAARIENMPKDDATQDILTEYEQPFELSGTGEIKNGVPHLHCVLAEEGDVAIAGHLHWARVETFFVNAYVIEM